MSNSQKILHLHPYRIQRVVLLFNGKKTENFPIDLFLSQTVSYDKKGILVNYYNQNHLK